MHGIAFVDPDVRQYSAAFLVPADDVRIDNQKQTQSIHRNIFQVNVYMYCTFLRIYISITLKKRV